MKQYSKLVIPKEQRWLLLLLIGIVVLLSFSAFATQKAEAAASDLFISEYIEGSSFNKAVEIYNGTGSTVDLDAGVYTLEFYFNGGVSAGTTIALTGTLAHGDVYVVADDGAAAEILAVTDLASASSFFNGDDAVVLKANGAVIDSIGQVGFDPGSEWGTGDVSTANNTIRRNADVCAGDTDPSDAYDPSTEWTGYAQDTFDGLGVHVPTCAGDVPPVVTSTSPANGDSGVALDTTISVTFSEDVAVAADSYGIVCSANGSVTASEDVTSNVYTLTPSSSFAEGETCDVTISASGVTDLDGSPLNMLYDYTFSFTTYQSLSCDTGLTPIFVIQGSGLSAAVTGEVITTGIVVGDYQDNLGGDDGELHGFYIQDETGDADATTSDGIFVYDPNSLLDVSLGQKVVVQGNAEEGFDETRINVSGVNGIVQDCGTTGTIAPTLVTLPVSAMTDWEPYEGMLITVQAASGDLTVTDNYTLGRYGTFYVSSGGRLMQYTEVNTPSDATAYDAYLAASDLRKLGIDDGISSQNPDPLKYPTPEFTASNTLRGGYTMSSVTGVLSYNFSEYKIQPDMTNFPPVINAAGNPRTSSPSAPSGTLRVASFNVLNYFNGPVFPDGRGANTADEFTRQNAKIVEALLGINADVVGLMEIENEAESPSAVETLVTSLNAIAGAGTYDFINTGVIGTDEIAQALIYKPASVTPVGNFAILDSSVDPTFLDTKNRPVLAQTFEDNNGQRFTVAVNHLKSKGSACDDVSDPDAGDGQGNCNGVRTAAATALANWLATDPTGSGDSDFLIIGDLNSYAKEDPIVALNNAGYTDLAKWFNGSGSYTYLFSAYWGSLDHAMANYTLMPQITGTQVWHINADEPIILDYNVEFKSANQIDLFYAADQYRASDHDPVVVDLTLIDTAELVSPTGTVTDFLGNPTYVWTDMPVATSYDLYIYKGADASNAVVNLRGLLDADYCDGEVCTLDIVSAFDNRYWLSNGDYTAWMRVNPGGVWAQAGTFTIAAPAADPATVGAATETYTLHPVLNWTLPDAASYASWFELYLAPSNNLGTPVLRKWVMRGDVCGDMAGTVCAYAPEAPLARNGKYKLWMRSWGPAGNTGWVGGQEIILGPAAPTGLAVDAVNAGIPDLSWAAPDNVTWYQVWIGTLNPLVEDHNQWYSAADVGCDLDTTCTLTPDMTPLTTGTYKWYVRGWGPAGYTIGGSNNGWQIGPDIAVP